MRIKTKNILVSGLITVVIGFLILSFFFVIHNRHEVKWGAYNDKLFLFQDSVKSFIDTMTVAELRESDGLYWYNLYNKSKHKYFFDYRFHVLIWEFNDLVAVELKDILFKSNIDLDKLKFDNGETLNPTSIPHVLVKANMPFNNSFNININSNSNIIKWIDSTSYKGFFGKVDKFSLSNKSNEQLAFIDNDFKKVQTLVLIYKQRSTLYLIYVFSDYDFDTSVINLFKL